MKIHHIGYAVKNIENSQEEFEKLGFRREDKMYKDMDRNINVLFLINDSCVIELVSPIEEGSAVDNILSKVGNTPYHICYETDDIQKSIAELRGEKYKLLLKPKKAIAIENNLVAFLFKKDVGLIELVEIKTN